MYKSSLKTSDSLSVQPKCLWFLTLTFAMIILLANLFDLRIVHVFNLNTDAGTFLFPLTFILSDLITEVYGYKHARRAIWCGFLFNFIFILYGQIVAHLPSPNYPTHNAMFDTILSLNIRVIIASTLSYFCSEPVNSYLNAKMKIKTKGNYIGIRFAISTIIATGTDSIIFSLFAFYGIMSNTEVIALLFTMWLIKLLIAAIGLPFSIRFAKRLKKIEHLDIFDKNTNFNILSLDADYHVNDNEFMK